MDSEASDVSDEEEQLTAESSESAESGAEETVSFCWTSICSSTLRVLLPLMSARTVVFKAKHVSLSGLCVLFPR